MDAFRALSDPTRRAMLEQLARQDLNVRALTERFPISQPAISQHLKVLREAGLVVQQRQGRENLYQLRADGLVEVFDWVSRYRVFWEKRLDALGELLDEEEA